MGQNIDDFNRGCALALATLYRRFPVPWDIDITALEAGQVAANDTPDRQAERQAIYAATLKFLRDEGYIRFSGSDIRELVFLECVLTSRGLAALNRVPSAIKTPQKTAGETLLDLSRDILKASAQEAAKQALRVIFGA